MAIGDGNTSKANSGECQGPQRALGSLAGTHEAQNRQDRALKSAKESPSRQHRSLLSARPSAKRLVFYKRFLCLFQVATCAFVESAFVGLLRATGGKPKTHFEGSLRPICLCWLPIKRSKGVEQESLLQGSWHRGRNLEGHEGTHDVPHENQKTRHVLKFWPNSRLLCQPHACSVQTMTKLQR